MEVYVVYAYFMIASVIWYINYALYVGLNGGNGVFKHFLRDITWYIPGGLRRRADFIRGIVNHPSALSPRCIGGSICGKTRVWHYNEIREQNLYQECARDVLGAPIDFWLIQVAAPFVWFISIPLFFFMRWYYSKKSTA